MSFARPMKRILNEVLPLSCANKSITQISRPYTLTSTTTTALLGRYPRRHRQICRSTIRQSHTEVDGLERGPWGSFSVSTFDPSALQPSDYVDTSHKSALVLRTSTQGENPAFLRLYYYRFKQTLRFPANTKGFLYLYRPPTTYHIQGPKGAPDNKVTVPFHPAAGQLRFRLVDSPDPTKFAQGCDLMMKPHKPWAIPLIVLGQYPTYHQIYEAMTSQTERDNIEAFVTRSRETACDAHSTSFFHGTSILNNILEPFIVDFSHSSLHLGLLDIDCIVKYHLNRPFVSGSYSKSPYSGRAVCRFEPAIRRSQKKIRRGLTIRVLKWVEPPNPDDVVVQEEGQILKKWRLKDEMPYFNGNLILPLASEKLLLQAFPTPESWRATLRFKIPPIR